MRVSDTLSAVTTFSGITSQKESVLAWENLLDEVIQLRIVRQEFPSGVDMVVDAIGRNLFIVVVEKALRSF